MSTTVQPKYRCASEAVSHTLFSADISLKWNPPVEKQLKEQPDSRRRHSIHTLMRAHIAKRAAQGEAQELWNNTEPHHLSSGLTLLTSVVNLLSERSGSRKREWKLLRLMCKAINVKLHEFRQLSRGACWWAVQIFHCMWEERTDGVKSKGQKAGI